LADAAAAGAWDTVTALAKECTARQWSAAERGQLAPVIQRITAQANHEQAGVVNELRALAKHTGNPLLGLRLDQAG
jgi:hypothetical protein